MAIYHCSVRTLSRADNHSAVAAAAYRSGSALNDARTGIAHNYMRRRGIVHASIFLPQSAPAALADRLTLWNAAESAETRKNARVAREVILALPHELSGEQRLSLTRDMALYLVTKYGVAVDAAVHAPQEAMGDDPRNHHAHLLFTTREVTGDGLGAKTRILDDKEQGPQQIELIRSVWETLANAALQQAGFGAVKIDRRTLEAQDIDRIPQEHVGKAGTHGENPTDDDPEDPRKKGEEDEGEETGTGKEKAGSGDKALTPPAAKKEPSSSIKSKEQTRASLHEEIKRLNEQRAAFSSVPLKVQIAELDHLLDRLDGRIQRLKTLSDKTSLPARITAAITSLYHRAMGAAAVRMGDKAVQDHKTALREARIARQQERYGKAYRAHIQERMSEMRENIQTLQIRQQQVQRYEAFVMLIERRVLDARPELKVSVPAIRAENKPFATWESIQEKTLKEALQARIRIPEDYQPKIEQSQLKQTFKATESKTSAIERPKQSFKKATEPPEDNGNRDIWHKDITVKIESLERIRTERIPIAVDTLLPDRSSESPQVWKINVNERGHAVLERMQEDIRERKAAIPVLQQGAGYSGVFNAPIKTTTTADCLRKTAIEAKTVRAKIPPAFRAAPYPLHSATPKEPSGFAAAWQKSSGAKTSKPVTTMSSKFNQAASTPEKEPSSTPDPKPKQ